MAYLTIKSLDKSLRAVVKKTTHADAWIGKMSALKKVTIQKSLDAEFGKSPADRPRSFGTWPR